MNQRAWATLAVKRVDVAQRIVEGIASTPTPDRGGDCMDPAGAQFVLPIPFLWFHDAESPIGEVFEATVTPEGIAIKAKVATVKSPGRLKTLVDDAWAAFTADPPLVRGLSIGWKELESEPLPGTKFTRFTKWIWGELSAVTIPMNTEATILSCKHFDLAASGLPPSGVTDTLPVVRVTKAAPAMKNPNPVADQITAFENTRAAKAAQLADIQKKASDEGRTKDDAEKQAFDDLKLQIKSIDAELVDLREMEKMDLAKAVPLAGATGIEASTARTGHSNVISVKSNLPKGTAFARYVMAIAASKGDKWQALEHAKQWKDSTPEVELYMKAAVAAGTTTDATWAAPLMPAAQAVMGEFLDMLRPATILGKLTKLTKVPFNVAISSQTGSGSYGWVGEGKPKPVSALAFAKVTLGFAKIAGIIVLTDELVKFSTPSAEERVRNDMIKGTAAFMDAQFIDPAVAEVVGVHPASITNGITGLTTAGSTAANALTDLKALIASFVVGKLGLSNSVLIMSEANAFALATAQNPLGQPAYPSIGIDGGSILGIPVITSQAAGALVILVDQEGILYADDGATTIDVSREASLQMDGAPDAPATATTILVSLWQLNMIGLRAERFCTWKRARLSSVAYITAATYV